MARPTYEYQFKYRYNGGAYSTIRDYNTSPNCDWTTPSDLGSYTLYDLSRVRPELPGRYMKRSASLAYTLRNSAPTLSPLEDVVLDKNSSASEVALEWPSPRERVIHKR